MSHATPNERRWTQGAWLTLIVTLGYLLAGVLYVLAGYRLPSDGWNSVYTVSTGWQVKLNQGGADLLRRGDRIVAVAGFDVDETNFLPPQPAPPGWSVGATARYTVVRDGRTIDLTIPLVQIATGELPRHVLRGTDGTNFAALICLLFGFAVFLLRPGSVAARLLLLILTYFMGTATVWFAVSTPASVFYPPLLFWMYQGTGVLWPLLFAAATHLTLAFPRRVWPLTQRPRVALGLLYALPAAGALLALATLSVAIYAPVLLVMMAVMVSAVIGATIYNLRTSHDSVERAQIGWVALGFGGTFVLAVLSAVASILVPGLGESGGYLTFLALPVCLGIAITRYRLFDIDVIIRRTLVYSMLTLALGAVYIGSVVSLQTLFVRLTGQGSMLAVVASTLVIAGLFGPLRARMQRFIDRRFFRRKYDAALVIGAFAQRAQNEADIDALAADVLGVVRETLEPDGARLWLVRTR